ncbi:MAG: metallophosphoesterase [Acidobacteria bacterium OLB17]|nr:MAG: metallophosphoesterase [Acidobacteria bacterium OLB17]MCZ2390138.1 exonuclease SbcCD subunit D [Acidobacteriota bacterium]
MKFLHIADVHLGCTRYHLPESPRDFFDAWIDVLRRYAIGENVDFVVMAGDFFHKRAVPPETMNYAVEGLSELRDAGIPVITIEGNHDQKYTDSEFSWLRSLSSWGLVKLLEPTFIDGLPNYEPWDASARRGGYIDVGRARIFGSQWFGAQGNQMIPHLTDAIVKNRREGAFHILLLHTDVEGHQVHPIPALSVEELMRLRSAVEYVGLGHTHMRYEIDNWAFNPGSIEVTNIAEYREDRGVFIVEVDDAGQISARHTDEYDFRPFQQLSFSVDGIDEPRTVTEKVLEMVGREARPAEPGKRAPIIEISLRGRLGFPNSQLEVRKIRDRAAEITSALHIRIKNHTVPVEYLEAEPAQTDEGRHQIERRVVEGLVLRDARYKNRAEAIAEAVIGAKRMALGDESPEKIAEFIAQKAAGLKASETSAG